MTRLQEQIHKELRGFIRNNSDTERAAELAEKVCLEWIEKAFQCAVDHSSDECTGAIREAEERFLKENNLS